MMRCGATTAWAVPAWGRGGARTYLPRILRASLAPVVPRFGRIRADSTGVDSALVSQKGSTEPSPADLRHLRGDRRDPAARDLAGDLGDAHQVARALPALVWVRAAAIWATGQLGLGSYSGRPMRSADLGGVLSCSSSASARSPESCARPSARTPRTAAG